MKLRDLGSTQMALACATAAALVLMFQPDVWAQHLTPAANPPTGLAGVTNSYITGTGFPSGAITGATINFGKSCAAPAIATTPVTLVTTQLTLRRFSFQIPASLASGTYSAWVEGTAGGAAFNTVATPSCSTITVTASSTTLASCVPTSSLAVVSGTNVNAYVPFGHWGGSFTGIAEVPLEGTGTATTFKTPGVVNSCAANSVTGEVVCTENSNNVDLINGTTLSTITSSANAYASFSGGSCMNCAVAIDATHNTALIAGGFTGGSSNQGVQQLDLATSTFGTPFPMNHPVSEDISIDSSRNLVLSPDESGYYDLLQFAPGKPFAEYGEYIGGELDSAAEDCTTGIALSSNEFSDEIYISDLTQATFTPGAPGTWSAPGQFVSLDDYGYAAGTSGLSSAPGTNHLAVVTGEYGGSSYSALRLPAKSGSGIPTLADWAYVEIMPMTPDGNAFSAGYDPHTVTAYTSPNSNRSYAVFADYNGYFSAGHPTYLGVVDLACVLSQPRITGTHIVAAASGSTTPGDALACTTYVAVP